jgi:hypothetical protein
MRGWSGVIQHQCIHAVSECHELVLITTGLQPMQLAQPLTCKQASHNQVEDHSAGCVCLGAAVADLCQLYKSGLEQEDED